MEVYKLENEIATLKFSGTDLYAGTYHYENGRRIGAIYKNNVPILATTGTFEIDTKEGVPFAANSGDVTKICEKTTINNTKHMNTSIHASDMITVTSSIGTVLLYDDKLQLQKEITLCKGHIIWIAKKYENLLVAGCDCGKLFFYDLRNDNYKCHKRESGITSVYMKNGKTIVGAYDGKLIVYDVHFEVESEHILGNVWRIIDVEENMGLSCMYDGVKTVDNAFNVINSYTTNNIAYGIDYCNKKLVFSDFYEKTYCQVDYNNTD